MYLDANAFFGSRNCAIVHAVHRNRLFDCYCANVFRILFSPGRNGVGVYNLGYYPRNIVLPQSEPSTSQSTCNVHMFGAHDVLFRNVANDPFLAQCVFQSAYHICSHVRVAEVVWPDIRGSIVYEVGILPLWYNLGYGDVFRFFPVFTDL